ncbi:MAG TPA: hypothetical protein VFR90_17580 [Methylibium sp.]|uniref:hypothetical protein n=1 Tax=Methylibium sp. TaxID=2067992 RepID=UPI002DBF3888|nr:hypothetical protein [Methylibium sp.]HEU4460936.1 hypothetical protein [Methylibium sp.]
MSPHHRFALSLCLMLAAAAPAALAKTKAPRVNDYPTIDRVTYVQSCMRQHPGNSYEMLSKCACTLDKIASQVPFAEFETMVTATNANSIGGERGNEIRDAEILQKEIRRFRELQTASKKSCFIDVDAK